MIKSKTLVAAILVGGLASSPASAQSLLDRLSDALKPKAGQQTSTRTTSERSGALMASIQPQQVAAIDTLLAEPAEDPEISADRADAMPLIRQLVTIGACAQSGEAWNSVNRFYVTPITHYRWIKTPMFHMEYHDKATCLDTTRISDWSKPADNAVKFRASYVSAASGEAAVLWFELQKATNGSWMIRKISAMP